MTDIAVLMRENSRLVDRKGDAAHQGERARRARSCGSAEGAAITAPESVQPIPSHYLPQRTPAVQSNVASYQRFLCIIHQSEPSYPWCPVRKTRSWTEPLFSCTSQSEDWTGGAALPGLSFMEKASATLADDQTWTTRRLGDSSSTTMIFVVMR